MSPHMPIVPRHRPRRSWELGSRDSTLALVQAMEVLTKLREVQGSDSRHARIVQILTSGDRLHNRPLADFGGKGLFVGEIDTALVNGEIDLATHSAKDLPGTLDPRIELVAALPRIDCADVTHCRHCTSAVATLPEGAKIGTASPRRQAQLLRQRPDLNLGLLRGNIETRFAAIRNEGRFDATLLAMAGLRRLGIEGRGIHRLDPAEWLPALGQGTVVVDRPPRRRRGPGFCAWRERNEPESWDALAAERAFLSHLGGGCHSPIAGLARVTEDEIELRGEILRPDGSESHSDCIRGARGEAKEIGHRLAEILLERAGAGFWGD